MSSRYLFGSSFPSLNPENALIFVCPIFRSGGVGYECLGDGEGSGDAVGDGEGDAVGDGEGSGDGDLSGGGECLGDGEGSGDGDLSGGGECLGDGEGSGDGDLSGGGELSTELVTNCCSDSVLFSGDLPLLAFVLL